jgi:hypothetical protein
MFIPRASQILRKKWLEIILPQGDHSSTNQSFSPGNILRRRAVNYRVVLLG